MAQTYNVFDGDLEYEADESPGYCRRWARFGDRIGARKLGGTVYVLEPGERICPYHYEYGNEEWLLVLDGEPMLRTPEGERPTKPGDLVVFREGPEGAHGVINRTGKTARVLMLSTTYEPAAVVYPDSDKIGVWPAPNRQDHVLVFRDAHQEYLAGEPEPD